MKKLMVPKIELILPATEADLQAAWRWMETDPDKYRDDHMPETAALFVRNYLANQAAKVYILYTVLIGGTPRALLAVRRWNTWACSLDVVIAPDAWQKDLVQSIFFRAVHEIEPYAGKITMNLFADVPDLREWLEEIGWSTEGVFRALTVRRGTPAHVITMGCVTSDFQPVKAVAC